MTIGLINYGSGNYRSVRNALEYIKTDFVEVSQASELEGVSKIILPGVGAFNAVMKKLAERKLLEQLRVNVLERKKLFLGICVGLQILADIGEEFTETAGLGFIGGRVTSIPAKHLGLPVPHIGWSEVNYKEGCPLFNGIGQGASFYFVHSFHFEPSYKTQLEAWCHYGEQTSACIGRDNIWGVQFHPEKSQRDGLRLLQNFSQMSPL